MNYTDIRANWILKTVSSLYILYRMEDVFLRFTKFCWLTIHLLEDITHVNSHLQTVAHG